MSELRPKHRMRLVDLIIPVGSVAYAIYYIASVSGFPFEARITGMVLGVILVGFCALYFASFLWEARRRGVETGLSELLGDNRLAVQRVGFTLLMVAWIYLAPSAGYTLTTFVFLAASFVLLGARPMWRVLAVAAAVSVAGWLFFIVLLGTRFPPGPFEQLARWIF